MMKRTLIIHWFISFALGITIGGHLQLAIQYSSVASGVLATIATIAFVFNIACGPDHSEEEKDTEN